MTPVARSGGAVAALIAMLLLRAAAGTEPARSRALRSNAAVTGQVLNGVTGRPVPDARVALSTAPDWTEGVTTDTQGRFVLRDLPQEPFIVSASIDRWAGELTGRGSYGQQTWSSPPRTLEVADGQIVRGIVVPFWPDGVITGRVTDAAGDPMAGAVVDEMRLSAGAGWRGGRDSRNRAETDDRGVYRLVHAPGSFFMAVNSDERRARSIDSDAVKLQAFAFLETFYPGVTNPSDARPIVLRPGEERSIDFQLVAVPAARVGGVVLANGAPAAGASVRLESIGSLDGSPVQKLPELVTDSLGRFSFPAVLPGDYQLWARSEGGCGSDDGEEALAVRVNVTTEEVEGMRITMSPCPFLTGEVRFLGRRPPTERDIDAVWINGTRDGRITAAGRFEVHLPPGRQEFTLATPDEWTVRSITVDGRDATDRPIDLPPGTTHHVVVVLTDAPASVSCVVVPAPGAPSQPAEVYLFPVDECRRRDGPRPDRKVRERGVCNGSVCFDDVPPGEYFVIAVHGLDDDDFPAAPTMERMQSRARRIRVDEGETKELSLQVVDASSLPEPRTAFVDERRLAATGLLPVAYGQESPAQPPAARDAVIRGRVIIAGSDAPLAGAIVMLERHETPLLGLTMTVTTISDESGRFAFADVVAGVYNLMAERPPFAPGAFGAGRLPGPATPLVVRAGARLQDVDIRMYAGASIGGLVTDASGAALGRASVELFRITWTVQGPVVRWTPVQRTPADDRGRYRFWGLPAGEYALEADASAARDSFPVTTAADPLRVMNFRHGAARYPTSVRFGSEPTFGVILVVGEDRIVDLQLPPGSPQKMWVPQVRPSYPDATGRVVFAAGSAPPADLSAISIVMKPLDSLELSQPWRRAPLDTSGRFRIKNPSPERYQWGVVTPGLAADVACPVRRCGWIVTSVMVNGRESLDSGTHTVDDGRVEDVVVTLSDRPASIEGTIVVAAGTGSGVPDGTYVVLYPAESAARLPQSPRVRAVKPDSDRHFTFEGLVPGVYLVATVADVPEGAWWDPAVMERLSASATRIAVGPGSRGVLQVR